MRKLIILLVLISMQNIGCSQINNLSMETTRGNERIIAEDRYYYFQGKRYNYYRNGITQLDSLFNGIPEAELEMEAYKSNMSSYNAWIVIGLTTGLFLMFYDINTAEEEREVRYDPRGFTYSVKEEKKGMLGLPPGTVGIMSGAFTGIIGSTMRSNAINNIKRAAMYYNKSIDNK